MFCYKEKYLMKKVLLISSTLLLAFSLTACQNMKGRDIGTVAGGATGALVGSQIGKGSGQAVAIAGGAVVGAVVGHQVGKSMEKKK
ncbi:MAG: glycine zipper 2TM domain-containing protein [Gammaproteobacteria bacterium]|nr:glycine zipper 2TM domain-containing protein [Gammaproteobacteria bacterium]MBU1628578.1 glycine zipper 2TM domain-containing protein [Gammaproteobacteria bacterium]